MIGRSIGAQRTVIYRKGAKYWSEPGLGLQVVCWTADAWDGKSQATILQWWYKKEGKCGLETVDHGEYLLFGDDAVEQAVDKWKELQKTY